VRRNALRQEPLKKPSLHVIIKLPNRSAYAGLSHFRRAKTPTITHEQIKTLLDITKSLAAKYRRDKPVDYMKELELLTGLIKEL
jgi:hypothetical protein